MVRKTRTTKRAALEALAERCEHATGPDWELDVDIEKAINGVVTWRSYQLFYTASLDAAMLLVPPKHRVVMDMIFSPDARAHVMFYENHISGEAKTLALALCAAALRARTVMEDVP